MLLTRDRLRLRRRRWERRAPCGISQKAGFACASWAAPSQAPGRRHAAGAGHSTDASREIRSRTMGDGVTGSTNAPANQPANAGRSGDSSAADAAAKAKFGEALTQELCPPGLTLRPREG